MDSGRTRRPCGIFGQLEPLNHSPRKGGFFICPFKPRKGPFQPFQPFPGIFTHSDPRKPLHEKTRKNAVKNPTFFYIHKNVTKDTEKNIFPAVFFSCFCPIWAKGEAPRTRDTDSRTASKADAPRPEPQPARDTQPHAPTPAQKNANNTTSAGA